MWVAVRRLLDTAFLSRGVRDGLDTALLLSSRSGLSLHIAQWRACWRWLDFSPLSLSFTIAFTLALSLSIALALSSFGIGVGVGVRISLRISFSVSGARLLRRDGRLVLPDRGDELVQIVPHALGRDDAGVCTPRLPEGKPVDGAFLLTVSVDLLSRS